MEPSERESAPDVEAPREGEPPRAGRGRRVPLGTVGAVVAMCLVVTLFAAVTHRPNGTALEMNPNRGTFGVSPTSGTLGVNPNGPAAPADWQTYRDPLGLFSVRLPKQWRAQVSTSQASFGDRTGSASEPTETIQFSDPALGGARAQVDVNASPIQSAFERHWYCQAFPQKNGTFHGIPAGHNQDATWLFDTANAHFQLDVWIPGVLEPWHSHGDELAPVPTATPLPQATVAADRAVLGIILCVFHPTNATALSCP